MGYLFFISMVPTSHTFHVFASYEGIILRDALKNRGFTEINDAMNSLNDLKTR